MSEDRPLPFSQRNGLSPVPPQLTLGQLSRELRNQLHYPVYMDFAETVQSNYHGTWLEGRWLTILRDYWVVSQGRNILTFNPDPQKNADLLRNIFQAPLGELFDFIEFLLQHLSTPWGLRHALQKALVDGRSAYRILDGRTIAAVGSGEQAAAIVTAIDQAVGAAPAAATHIVNAGAELRRGNWPASVRESIHAVESIAVQLTGKGTLGDALNVLERRGHLHGSLKAAFAKLYGYTSDEEGVRHALVFNDDALVDESDALFMLGACASFVSYLLAKGHAGGLFAEGATASKAE